MPVEKIFALNLSKQCNTVHLSPTINLCLYSTIYGDKNAKHTEWRNQNNVIAQLKNYTSKNRFELAEEALSFPHRYIEAIYGKYLFYSVSPITDDVKYKYDTNKRIYDNINEIRHDINKWIKCIKGIQDKEVIIQNIELKLGKYSNYKNKNLWKFYFKFLKKNNLKEILEAYRKYTRLFISDKEAIEKYRQEIIKFTHLKESTTKYWIDTIKYEMTFGNLEHAYGILECGMEVVVGTQYNFLAKDEKHLNGILLICRILMMQAETNPTPAPAPATISNHQIEVKHLLSQTPTVYFECANRQSLPFRQSYIQYILNNANAIIRN
uniref:Uncharacterized protein n=1 Tax=Panagrolaimus superbus TaxID=310955 RepID=A0A914YMH7_9BILA